MRLFITYSHTSTLRGYEASRKTLQIQQKTSNEERKTGKKGYRTLQRMAKSTGARAITSNRIARLPRKGLEQVAAYRDDLIVFDSDPSCSLRATAQAQPQALPLESQTRRGRRYADIFRFLAYAPPYIGRKSAGELRGPHVCQLRFWAVLLLQQGQVLRSSYRGISRSTFLRIFFPSENDGGRVLRYRGAHHVFF